MIYDEGIYSACLQGQLANLVQVLHEASLGLLRLHKGLRACELVVCYAPLSVHPQFQTRVSLMPVGQLCLSRAQ